MLGLAAHTASTCSAKGKANKDETMKEMYKTNLFAKPLEARGGTHVLIILTFPKFSMPKRRDL